MSSTGAKAKRRPSFWDIFNDSRADLLVRIILTIALLYFFLVGVKSLETSIKLMGSGFAKGLFDLTASPILSLFAGMMATVLMQSSSVTTAVIVGLVSSGTLTIGGAVPMIMGANLGTSVTNTLVSLGYFNNRLNFKRAFAAATIHDSFNILSVLVIFPIEMATGFLEKSATWLANTLYGTMAGLSYTSPIKASIKPLVASIKGFVTNTLALEGNWSGIVLMLISVAIIFVALASIVRIMDVLVESNKGEILNNILSKNPLLTILFGIGITIAVQSSSITTSLLVPFAGTGILSLQVIFPVTIGANIGTTATALLAALAGNVFGLSIALVHLFFNICGTLVWFPNKKMRAVPLAMSTKLAELTEKSRKWAFLYVGSLFFLVPGILIFFFG
jgi:sodium-dependent phosphate cotransporter